jgi:broad specificity phosphatase PhoE
MKIHRALAALLLLAACRNAPQQAVPISGTTMVVLVRHAEKAAEPAADPPLTEAGEARAIALSEYVKSLPVMAVITTQFARTRATAAPLAARLGVAPEVVDARAPNHAQLVAQGILARHRNQTVVVVGHSNTIPDIIAALGAPRVPPICDSDYDGIYLVWLPDSGGRETVQHLHYGQRTLMGDCNAGQMRQ